MLNPWFNQNNQQGDDSNYSEASMMQNLYAEVVQIHGMDVTYLPRQFRKLDRIFGEDLRSSFIQKFVVEMMMEESTGFMGEDMIAKFGVDIHDSIVMLVSQKRWKEEAIKVGMDIDKGPLPGDLIVFPYGDYVMEIRHCEDEKPFYPGGYQLQYKLTCEVFDYSNEHMATGNAKVDGLNDFNTTDLADIADNGLLDELMIGIAVPETV